MPNCLCINPNCPNPQRSRDEQPCPACASPLLLNGRYRATHLLHQRNIVSAVFEAIDVADGNNSKVLKVIYTDNQEAISRFNREADVLMNYWFKGIPRGYSEGYFHVEFPNNPKPAYCLVMEKIEGMNLQEWMESRDNQPISEREAIDWLRELVIILGRLHEQKFYHRDIKPSNIMRRENGQLILIDLGAVRAVTQAVLNGADVTRIGTDGYGAPEQLRQGIISATSDFYALGRTFVHLLTGEHPNNLREDSPEKLRWQPSAPKVSKQFADFIDSLMAYSPEKRPQNTTDILQRLAKIESDLQFQEEVKSFFNFQLTFRNIAGGIGVLVVFLVLILIYYRNQNITSVSTLPSIDTPTPTPSDYTACRKGLGEAVSASGLSDRVQKFLEEEYKRNTDLDQFKGKITASQNNCKVVLSVFLSENEILSDEIKSQIEKMIVENFPEAEKTVQWNINVIK
ncbi:serine/threonine protein kinase [Limnofasciculus baicalensis]|uniref:Serine/threonine protein kinase n=1 Tax=Limnofasciculus baicalensis BBK-W-15 TaxID=2699891 RepID=A0AAE3KNR0_9CYAN|nr:serine/threonine-protein kinase [Limnofasciculus baicalensis]MCP2730081.1 serine/threonine protein kinase [Limnofasciculus baicalensis BBK-W-15]